VWGAGSGGRGRRQNPAALTCGELYHPLSSFGSAGCNLQMFNLIVSSITVWTGVTYDGVGVGRLISYKIQLKIELI